MFSFFFFNDTATTEIYTLSLHDALPICQGHKFFRGASAHEVSAYFELIGAVLQEGIAAGEIRSDVPVKVATKILFGAMDQVATSWVLGKRAYRLSDAADPVASIFLKGVCVHGV